MSLRSLLIAGYEFLVPRPGDFLGGCFPTPNVPAGCGAPVTRRPGPPNSPPRVGKRSKR